MTWHVLDLQVGDDWGEKMKAKKQEDRPAAFIEPVQVPGLDWMIAVLREPDRAEWTRVKNSAEPVRIPVFPLSMPVGVDTLLFAAGVQWAATILQDVPSTCRFSYVLLVGQESEPVLESGQSPRQRVWVGLALREIP